MEYLFIYLLQISETIGNIAGILLFVMSIIFIASFMIYCVERFSEYSKKNKDILEISIGGVKLSIVFIAIAIFLFFLPTKQTLVLMGGTYYGKKVFATEKMQK